MLLSLFPHLLHHVDSLLLAPCDLAFELLYALFLIHGLSAHLLLLLILLLGESLLIFEVLELLLVELFKLCALLSVTSAAKLFSSLLLQGVHLLLDGGDFLVVFLLHGFKQVLGESLVRGLDLLKKILFAFQFIFHV